MIVDASPEGEIKAIFEEEIAKSNLKIRVIERPGMKHQFITMVTNENKKSKCPPDTCLVCDTEKGGNCRSKEVVYEIACKSCNSKNPKTITQRHKIQQQNKQPGDVNSTA